MKLTHLFFDLVGTVVDAISTYQCWPAELGKWMAAHYGQSAAIWTAAYVQIKADWDSYYADLDLGGEHGIEDMWEGQYRTTRALFRLAAQPEPPQNELRLLSRQLPCEAAKRCARLYPEIKTTLKAVYLDGYQLGAASLIPENQSRAMLEGGDLIDLFSTPIVGPDTANQYRVDEEFFRITARLADVEAKNCLAVSHRPGYLAAAKQIGMTAAYLKRDHQTHENIYHLMEGDLTSLPALLKTLNA